MTYKTTIFVCIQWVVMPVLVIGLISWSVSPTYPQADVAKPDVPPQVKTRPATDPKTDLSADMQEVKDRLKEMEVKERQNYALVLEGQRKTMDWWFSFLGVLTAVMAIFGALIPFLMARKDKELIEQDKEQIKQMLADAGGLVEQIQEKRVIASQAAEQAKKHVHDAEEDLANFTSGMKDNVAKAEKTLEDLAKTNKAMNAVATVQQDPTSDPSRGLRAAAIAASQAEQADKAYTLWRALTELNPTDVNAQFNAGYWAQDMAEKSKGDDAVRWFRQAGQHYESTLKLDLGKVEAAYNWGNALLAEAEALAGSDLAAARTLWRQAGEKYEQTLRIKPDRHEAANNWGLALLEEVSALSSMDGEQINPLLDRAADILLAHAASAPGVVAYSLACVYGRRGDVTNCLRWLEVSKAHNTLPNCESLRTDRYLDVVRTSPEFLAWLHSVCPQ